MNDRHQRAAAKEMAAFDSLPSSIRAAINESNTSARATVIRDTLLRGVSAEKIIEMIKKYGPRQQRSSK